MVYDVQSHRWLWHAPHSAPTGYRLKQGFVSAADSGSSASQRTSRPRRRQRSIALGDAEAAAKRPALPLQIRGNPRRDIRTLHVTCRRVRQWTVVKQCVAWHSVRVRAVSIGPSGHSSRDTHSAGHPYSDGRLRTSLKAAGWIPWARSWQSRAWSSLTALAGSRSSHRESRAHGRPSSTHRRSRGRRSQASAR